MLRSTTTSTCVRGKISPVITTLPAHSRSIIAMRRATSKHSQSSSAKAGRQKRRNSMYTSETKVRVRYGETDQMGYAYYGVYAMYYEVARVESLRQLGLTYKELEEMDVMLPVLENHTKFISPAYYDDE